MKKSLKSIILLGAASLFLTGCGEPAQTTTAATDTGAATDTASGSEVTPEVVPTLEKTYITSSYEANALQGYDCTLYQLNVYSGNYYQYLESTVKYGYSMTIGVTNIFTYGTYELGTEEDGIAQLKLGNPAEATINSYSLAGGFDIAINTISEDQTYPVELPAKVQGEVNMANSEQDVLDYVGKGFNAYVETASNVFSFSLDEDPMEKEENDKTSGELKNFADNLKKVAAVGNFDINFKETEEGKALNTFNVTCDIVLLSEENFYSYTSTKVQYGYSMLLATTSTTRFGEATLGEPEDGSYKVSLAKADEVNLASFSKAGGFNISINTADPDLQYPVELPATQQGEKNIKNNKQEVLDEVGPATDFYMFETKGLLSATNPNE